MDTGNLLFGVVIMGAISYSAVGWFFRSIFKPEIRWRWFFIIWIVGIIALLIAINL